MNTTEADKRDALSDSHRDFMVRYVEFETLRQQRISERFLASRLDQQGKVSSPASKRL